MTPESPIHRLTRLAATEHARRWLARPVYARLTRQRLYDSGWASIRVDNAEDFRVLASHSLRANSTLSDKTIGRVDWPQMYAEYTAHTNGNTEGTPTS